MLQTKFKARITPRITENVGYSPRFFNVVKNKGHFIIGEESLQLEKTECLIRDHKSFNDWLDSKNLKLTKTGDQYKIHRK